VKKRVSLCIFFSEKKRLECVNGSYGVCGYGGLVLLDWKFG